MTKMIAKTLIVIVAATLGCSKGAHAWSVEYSASTGLLPVAASPAWQTQASGTTTSDVGEGVLHINSDGGGYLREGDAIGAGVPVTVETRMRVLSDVHGAWLSIGTYSGVTGISVYANRIVTGGIYGQPLTLWGDFTAFHTIRLAYDGAARGYLWVDDQLALPLGAEPWPWATGPPDGVRFGSYLNDSYWQYVAYSKEFLPLPEPSSLLAILAGLGGLGMVIRRRSRLLLA